MEEMKETYSSPTMSVIEFGENVDTIQLSTAGPGEDYNWGDWF